MSDNLTTLHNILNKEGIDDFFELLEELFIDLAAEEFEVFEYSDLYFQWIDYSEEIKLIRQKFSINYKENDN